MVSLNRPYPPGGGSVGGTAVGGSAVGGGTSVGGTAVGGGTSVGGTAVGGGTSVGGIAVGGTDVGGAAVAEGFPRGVLVGRPRVGWTLTPPESPPELLFCCTIVGVGAPGRNVSVGKKMGGMRVGVAVGSCPDSKMVAPQP